MSPDADPIEELFARGVTDGLPVVPPTAERVRAAVAASGRVMAGCRPEYLPVVLAAVEAICDPDFALVGVSGTTDAVTPLVIVNGPIRRSLEVNCAVSVFGAGFRVNATIGRAVRLVWVNVGGARPGVISMSTFGQPGRYSYCIGEREEASPWEPLSVEHGFAAVDSTVAVMAAESPQVVVNAEGRRGGRLVEGRRAALRLGAVSGHRRRHRRPLLRVGAGLAVPRRALAPGPQACRGPRATIGTCPSPMTRASGSSSKPIRCRCGSTTLARWPFSR